MGPSTFAFAIAECCRWVLSWVIGEGHDSKKKSSRVKVFKIKFFKKKLGPQNWSLQKLMP